MRWVRRREIAATDALSKEPDRWDFGVRRHVLAGIVQQLGWPADELDGDTWVDRFASPHNAVCRRSSALYTSDDSGLVGVDAFGLDWSSETS